MGARSATAATLDSAISSMLTAYDAYAALKGQTGENKDAAPKYFWQVLMHRCRQKATLEVLIDSGVKMDPVHKSQGATSVVTVDPFA